uniref:Uncharacterized protein n=1 Tax=Sinocyclocheilus grahami TaxID=75366 RepID=A0A672K3F5_SINGR
PRCVPLVSVHLNPVFHVFCEFLCFSHPIFSFKPSLTFSHFADSFIQSDLEFHLTFFAFALLKREDDIKRVAESVRAAFGKVDWIIPTMLHPSGKGETSLRDMSAQYCNHTLRGIFKLFSPLLQNGTGGFGQQSPKKEKQHSGVIMNMTAREGSMVALGGWYRYRMSKADSTEILW